MRENIRPATVTCLMTAHNAAPYIEEAIVSLVTQSHPPAEIILVDDGSTDDTANLAKKVGGSLLRIIRQENAGVAAGRNRGLQEIRHPFVMFADADDISLPDRIAHCLDAFVEHPELSAVFAKWQNFWIDELAHEELAEQNSELKGVQNTRSLCTGLFRSDFVHSLGGFDTSLRLSEVMWVTNATKTGGLIHDLNQMTYLRRIHFTNISRQKSDDDLFNMIMLLRNNARSS